MSIKEKLEVYRIRRREHSRYCLILGLLVMCCSILGGGVFYRSCKSALPSEIYLATDHETAFHFHIPATAEIVCAGQAEVNEVVNLNRTIKVKTADRCNYEMSVELFGVIPLKQVGIHVVEDQTLLPMGNTIGIYLKTKGILVVDSEEFIGQDGKTYDPAGDVLQPGDYIFSVDGREVNTKEEFCELISKSEGKDLLFTVLRDDATILVKVTPKQNKEGVYKIGAWIKDDLQGVGTLTYMDEKGRIGALGHGINDGDVGKMLKIEDGTLYEAQVAKIRKGVRGKPGEITGLIDYQDEYILADISKNTSAGLFGKANEKLLRWSEYGEVPALQIAFKQDIKEGKATILSAVSGKVKGYDIEITGIHLGRENINKGIELKVTDEELLALTGGIVQGMSGSPILQDGKIIGAVTHVLVQDPTRGYGIFIENMLEYDP